MFLLFQFRGILELDWLSSLDVLVRHSFIHSFSFTAFVEYLRSARFVQDTWDMALSEIWFSQSRQG